MAARRGKSQARRNPSNGIPGWAWLIAGVLLGIVVLLATPRFLKSDAADDFFRPKPNPDARPAANAGTEDDDAIVPESAEAATAANEDKPKETQYDFYTVLPGKEVAMSDAELAASARAEAERAERAQREQPSAPTTQPPQNPPAAAPNSMPPAATAAAASPAAAAAAAAAAAVGDAHYILQAGAFGASGDAEAVKAKIALLGLSARVESAQINGKTVYRVRMGPYGTASELAEAKQKLGTGGLPALAIKAQ